MKITELDREFFKTLKMTDEDIAYIESLDEEEIKHMFGVAVGNPPYQEGNQQIYTDFYLLGRYFSKGVNMIFPTGWQEPKDANRLNQMNSPEVKYDKQIVGIYNIENAFKGIAGAEYTNIVLWQYKHNNHLDKQQYIANSPDDKPKPTNLYIKKEDLPRPKELIQLSRLVSKSQDFESLIGTTSAHKPYGLRADVVPNLKKYRLPDMPVDKDNSTYYTLYASKGIKRYLPKDYPIPKISQYSEKYKVFIPKAWGNMDESTGLGGAYADIMIAKPRDIVTETYIESGLFNNNDTTKKHAKYLLTKFTRALLYMNKYSQNTAKGSYKAIPQQTYTEAWWDTDDLDELDEHLFDKYSIPEDIRTFVRKNIQPRTIANIIEL